MDGPRGSVRERQITYDFTYIWNLKNKTNRKRLINTENRLMVAKGEAGQVGEKGKRIEKHTVVVTK